MGIQQTIFSSLHSLSNKPIFDSLVKPTPTNTMAFYKTLFIAAMATVAIASPQGASDGNTKVDASKTLDKDACGNGSKLACCNGGEDLIGLNCASVPILAIPIQQRCGSNVAACCDSGDNDGNLISAEANCAQIPL